MSKDKSPSPSDERARAVESHLDATFRALADERRRETLRYLDGRGASALADLADHLTDDDGAVRRTYTSLYHNHLPLLSAADLVEYDADAERVELTADADSLGTALDATRRLSE